MNCEEARLLLHALVDGELDAGHAREVEAHVAGCPHCAASCATPADASGDGRGSRCAMRRPRACAVASRKRCRAPRRRFAKPAEPAERVRARQRVLGGRGGERARVRRAHGTRSSAASARSCRRICARCRPIISPTCNRAISTPSSPGSTAELDVSPPVVDLTSQGFTLLGGRLDYIDGRAVATVVYRRRVHIINLFVTQSTGCAARQSKGCRGSTSGAGPGPISISGPSATSPPTSCRNSTRNFRPCCGRAEAERRGNDAYQAG